MTAAKFVLVRVTTNKDFLKAAGAFFEKEAVLAYVDYASFDETLLSFDERMRKTPEDSFVTVASFDELKAQAGIIRTPTGIEKVIFQQGVHPVVVHETGDGYVLFYTDLEHVSVLETTATASA